MSDTADRFRRQREWFHRLFDATPEERAAGLEELSQKDPAIWQDVAKLLAAANASYTETLETLGALAEEAYEPPPPLADGTLIEERFRIRSPLGTGGMGEVYLAERVDAPEQRVALKLLRHEGGANAHRLLRERRILARLTHPNIAHLIDGGLNGERPWFAMELVEGEPITKWCDARRASVPERVRALLPICDAVQHAHRSLILHRDIKPSNILVTADGVPKLLDFGIAKPLDDAGSTGQQTQTLAFTPAYASPEQLHGEAITTASDVYQIGLVLYELVTGLVARNVRHESADGPAWRNGVPRAYDAFARLDVETARKHAERRDSGREALLKLLRGDLGAIVGKATADDPNERYDSAASLALDLRRWLDGRAILAQRATPLYRFGKFLRRHRMSASFVVIGVAAILATFAGLVWQYRQAQSDAALAQWQRDFFVELLSHADPARLNDELARLNRIDDAAELLEQLLSVQRERLGPRHEDIARTLVQLSALRQRQQRHAEAVALAEEAAAMHLELFGTEDEATHAALKQREEILRGVGRADEAGTPPH